MQSAILSILEQYRIYYTMEEKIDKCGLTYEERDEWRLLTEEETRYYHVYKLYSKADALRADVMVSLWTPYKTLLSKEAGWEAYKTVDSLKTLIRQITKKTSYTDKILKINERLDTFARVCYTKGNYILLPERKMNNERYSNCEDRIDQTLYESFEGGKLSHYFANDCELKDWITQQQLDILFINREISKDNLIWLADKHKKISEMATTEIYGYIERAVTVINTRNKDSSVV